MVPRRCVPSLAELRNFSVRGVFKNQKNDMKAIVLLLFALAVLLFTGCATNARSSTGTGRYQTVINDSGMAVMTDTKTGQAWASPVGQPAGFLNKDFAKPKSD